MRFFAESSNIDFVVERLQKKYKVADGVQLSCLRNFYF